MANNTLTLSVPKKIYSPLKRRRDLKRSEVAGQGIAETADQVKDRVGFFSSALKLRDMLAKAAVKLDEISVNQAARHYRKVRK